MRQFFVFCPQFLCRFANNHYLCAKIQAMDKETYARQKAFAGEKKPSMQRRCVGHDYSQRQMYMVTMVTEGRLPLFGEVVGHSEAAEGSSTAPTMVLTELGRTVGMTE